MSWASASSSTWCRTTAPTSSRGSPPRWRPRPARPSGTGSSSAPAAAPAASCPRITGPRSSAARTPGPDGQPGQWYLHLFAPEQPDFNWANADVQTDFEDVLRFWFDRGVDGFRIDSAVLLAKDPAMADYEPGAPGGSAGGGAGE